MLKRQLHLSTFLGRFRGPGGNGVQGCFHAQGLEQPQDLRADRLIDAQAPKRDASIATMIDVSTLAVIATGFPGRAAISDVKLTPTMATAQQPREEGLTASHCASRHHTLAGGIIGNQPLIPLKFYP
jgi:hypothetical protein